MIVTDMRLRAGRTPGAESNSIRCTPITVFVGPNNSGKSQILLEIFNICSAGYMYESVVLDSLQFSPIADDASAEAEFNKLIRRPVPGENIMPGYTPVRTKRGLFHVIKSSILDSLKNPNNLTDGFCTWLSNYTLRLDGPNRIQLIGEQDFGDLQEDPQSSFQFLFRDDDLRAKVRKIIFDAFGLYFVLDPTHIGKLRARLSVAAPVDAMQERGIHKEAAEFHSRASLISAASDGVKAFCGIITQVIAGEPRVIIIDEPEAFLHPALAFKLGSEIAGTGADSGKNVFVSTHSPNFVMGCLQAGTPVSIVRLTYTNGAATARYLDNADVVTLMRNPLLRSVGVISALFYEFVIVTESDADRAFYQEINERLVRLKPEWGIPNCLFLNAQNKQTVRTVIKPLRQMGIPAAGIVDIDVIKDGGADWTNLLDAAGVPQIAHQSMGQMRAAIKIAFAATGKDMKRDGGLNLLPPPEKEAAENLLAQLRDYGLFVVEGGELESWLKELGARRHGPPWLIEIFEKMGEDPSSATYLNPRDADVWKFISLVKDWLLEPSRKGIPN